MKLLTIVFLLVFVGPALAQEPPHVLLFPGRGEADLTPPGQVAIYGMPVIEGSVYKLRTAPDGKLVVIDDQYAIGMGRSTDLGKHPRSPTKIIGRIDEAGVMHATLIRPTKMYVIDQLFPQHSLMPAKKSPTDCHETGAGWSIC